MFHYDHPPSERPHGYIEEVKLLRMSGAQHKYLMAEPFNKCTLMKEMNVYVNKFTVRDVLPIVYQDYIGAHTMEMRHFMMHLLFLCL